MILLSSENFGSRNYIPTMEVIESKRWGKNTSFFLEQISIPKVCRIWYLLASSFFLFCYVFSCHFNFLCNQLFSQDETLETIVYLTYILNSWIL